MSFEVETPVYSTLSLMDKEILLIHLLRDERVIIAAKNGNLTPEDFGVYMPHMALLWAISLEWFQKNGKPIPPKFMESEFSKRTGDGWSTTLGQYQEEALRLIKEAYATPVEDLAPEAVITDILQPFLLDCRVRPLVGQVQEAADIRQAMEQLNTALSSVSIGGAEAANCFDPNNLGPPKAKPIATGCEVFDRLTDGGIRPGALMGIIAPTGGGKTQLAIQVGVGLARQKRHVALFQYEQLIVPDIRDRIWSCATGIDGRKFEGRVWEEVDPQVREAITAANRDYLCEYFHSFSMADSPVAGEGMPKVDESVADLVRSGRRPELVIVDWLGIMADLYLAGHKNYKPENLHSLLSLMCTHASTISKKYNTCVLICQQANTEAGKRGLTREPNAYEGANTGHLAWLMAHCLSIGASDEGNNMCRISTAKKRGPAVSVMAYNNGPICRFEVREGNYQLSTDRNGRPAWMPATHMEQ